MQTLERVTSLNTSLTLQALQHPLQHVLLFTVSTLAEDSALLKILSSLSTFVDLLQTSSC